jgi:small-conductance mechanosensitive channel
MEFLDRQLFDNSLREWAIALVVAGATYAALQFVRRRVVTRLGSLVERTSAEWDDILAHMLSRTKAFFPAVVGIYLASLVVSLPVRGRAVVEAVLVIGGLLQAGIWATAGAAAWLERYRQRKLTADPAAVTTVGALNFGAKMVVWIIVTLLALDNLGIDITALVAGLGVGGIAVALAVQNILGDLFASLTIVLDKPFIIGDVVNVGEFTGRIEHVGLKTTRIRSLSGEQLVFSNGDLLNSRLRNFGRLEERRIVFAIGVTYQTPREKLRQIPAMLRQAIEEVSGTRFDRAHFKAFGDFALIFEAVYFVQTPDYNTYMDDQQMINLRLHEMFEAERIEFAYPTQTLFVVKQEP